MSHQNYWEFTCRGQSFHFKHTASDAHKKHVAQKTRRTVRITQGKGLTVISLINKLSLTAPTDSIMYKMVRLGVLPQPTEFSSHVYLSSISILSLISTHTLTPLQWSPQYTFSNLTFVCIYCFIYFQIPLQVIIATTSHKMSAFEIICFRSTGTYGPNSSTLCSELLCSLCSSTVRNQVLLARTHSNKCSSIHTHL